MRAYQFLIIMGLLGAAFGAAAPASARPQYNAQQTEFRTGYRGHVFAYHYAWLNPQGQTEKMTFELKKEMAQQSNREFKRLSQEEFDAYTQSALNRYQPQNPKIQVRFVQTPGGYSANLSGNFVTPNELEREKQNIHTYMESLQQSFLKENLYHDYEKWGRLPDYGEITKLYTPRMAPVAEAIMKNTQGMSPRDRINYTLNFLQSIPYDVLTDRKNSNGSGYATPVEMLSRNLGDCDSKSVAFLSILRNMFPQTPMAIVLVPKHAFIGMLTAPQAGDATVEIDGYTFVLAEPVGPKLAKIGELHPDSARYLQRGDYTYVRVY